MKNFSIIDVKTVILQFVPQVTDALRTELAFACERKLQDKTKSSDAADATVSIAMIDDILMHSNVHLGFEPVLERHYLTAKQAARVEALDNFLIFSGVLFAMTIFLDWVQYPAIFWLCLWVKLVCTPIIVTVARTVLRHRPSASSLVAWGSAIAYQVTVLGYFLVSKTEATNPVIFVYALVAISTNTLIELSFPMSILCGVTTILVAVISAVVSPGVDLSNGVFSLSIVAIFVFFTLFGSVRMDVSSRLTFLYGLKEKLRIEELALDNKSLQYLAEMDGLTGVWNRRHFEIELAAATASSATSQLPMGLMMVDLDHFKKLNDVHGHQAGDVCLQAVAQALNREAARVSGSVARYGGEEFAIILPSATPEVIGKAAEAIRIAIETTPVLIDATHRISITASIGFVCAVPTPGCLGNDLVKIADGALYEAKKAGRNCVRTAVCLKQSAA